MHRVTKRRRKFTRNYSAATVSTDKRKDSPPFAALRAFDAVGKTGGIRRAAEALGVDHAVVSRHLRTLETWVGVPLIERLQAGGRLTPEGLRYHARISAAFTEIGDATHDLVQKATGERLRIYSAPGIASRWLASRLNNFRAAVPDLCIELQPSDTAPNFALHQADADIRYISDRHLEIDTPDARTRRVEIARPFSGPVASPEFLTKHPLPRRVTDLLQLPLIQKKTDDAWRAWFAFNGVKDTNAMTGIFFGQAHLTIEAARNGQGIALANPFLLDDDLQTGKLVQIQVGNPSNIGAYYFTTRTDLWASPPVARLRRWLQQTASESLAATSQMTARPLTHARTSA
jgi:LysR family glycine cleavage system transcriptional activator